MIFHPFWADEVADIVVERGKDEATVKSGASPSGGKHIGNLNDIMRGYFVYSCLESSGHPARMVHTCDDRDPLRKVPSRAPDLDGRWHEFTDDELATLNGYLGHPYVGVPDPFGCCENWARHFNRVWLEGPRAMGVKVENKNNNDMYRDGSFDPWIRLALERLDESREVLSRYQDVPPEYIPYNPICEECGQITARATGFDLDSWTVSYACEEKSLAGEYRVEGCGHQGESSLKDGKLPWRFEWPAQWAVLDVSMEPFGKDHAAGSWKSGREIARQIYDIEPPVPFVYEFFLVDGHKMSTREGNVYLAQDMLELVEPEMLCYFYSMTPQKQRNLDLRRLNFLVDAFDRFEEIALGKVEPADGEEGEVAKRSYPMCNPPAFEPVRVPYTFSALVGASENPEHVLRTLEKTGHLSRDATPQQREQVLSRVKRARNWARRFSPEHYFEVLDELPRLEISAEMDSALHGLAEILEGEPPEAELQSQIFEVARDRGLEPKELFQTVYRLFLGKERGPRLAPFLLAMDHRFALKRLRREK